MSEHIRPETVIHEGKKYIRVNPEDIDVSKMTLVQKVTDVFAAAVKKGRVKVVTKHGKEVETINYADVGDWVVYDIGGSDFKNILDKLLNCEKTAITKENFQYLYKLSDETIVLSPQAQVKVIENILMDNTDNRDFDSGFVQDLKRYKYIGKPVYAGYVPFNFVLRAPWMEDQFIKRGGLVIYDTNFDRHRAQKAFVTEDGRKNYEKENSGGLFYGIDGVHNRTPGLFEKTYSVGSTQTIIADTFKMAIQADRSPIAGIQFNNVELAKALDRIGKDVPGFLEKFLK